MKKLVLFGDSLLAQCGKHRIIMLEEKLRSQYDVYNFATGGWDTIDLLKKFEYVAGLRPDVMLLSVGTNDASPWKQVPLNKFIENLKKLLSGLSGSKIIYFLPMPIDENRHTPEKQRTNHLQKQYHDAARSVCEELGIDFINSWDIFLPMLESGQDYLVEDGVHLQDNAYEIIFDEVSRILK